MLMDFDMACIDHKPFKVILVDENLKKVLPYAFVATTTKTPMCIHHHSLMADHAKVLQYAESIELH